MINIAKKGLYYLKKHPRILLAYLFERCFSFIPDETYIKCLYRIIQGKKLNLKNPQLFTEKIQWLKLYGHKEEYTKLVDKHAVKSYVSQILGSQLIIPTIAIWENVNEIDFDTLPNSFVLKTTFGGGGNVIVCKDKKEFNIEECKSRLCKAYKQNIYKQLREYPYKNVPHRIIAEEYINFGNNEELVDYKFFCFGGEVKYCQVIQNRSSGETIDFYDTKWQHQEFIGLNPLVKHAPSQAPMPKNYNQMIDIATTLSKGMPFVRVDLYNVDGTIYFGEITFYPASGFGTFRPSDWDYKLGQMINLP